MHIWLSDKQRLESAPAGAQEYALEVPKDGRFEFHLWLYGAQPPGPVELSLNDHPLPATVEADQPPYYRCGSLQLPRGRHKLSLRAAALPERVFLSEDPQAVSAGRADLAWENRAAESAFEGRAGELNEEQRRLLRRHGFLFDHEHDAERCQVPAGVPLGGIGAGKVELTPEGLFTALTCNNNQDCPVYRLPGCFFALSVGDGGRPVTRLLQSEAVDQRLTPVQGLEAELAFPEGHLVYHDPALPVQIALRAFSPHVPGDVQLSSLPCAFFRFTLTNPTNQLITVRLLLSWESLINVGGSMLLPNRNEENLLPLVYHTWNYAFPWSNRAANFAQPAPLLNGTGLRFAAAEDEGNPSSFGEHLLWTPGEGRVIPDRDLEADEEAFSQWFAAGCPGEFTPQGRGEFRAGALVVERPLTRMERAHVDFVLAWHMPHWIDRLGQDLSVGYAEHFASAAEVVQFAWPRREELLQRSREVREILEDSHLPDWFTQELLDSRFVADTNTVLTRDGRFSVNEAPTGMCGCYGTLDQRTATGGLWTTFFPSLDAVELKLFSRAQSPEGLPSHDLGKTDLDLANTALVWPDLAAAYLLQVHRHVLRSGDPAFLSYHWPFARAALEWAISLDETGDAIPTLKAGRGTTFDNQVWDGVSSFCATMHEAALGVGADLARRVGESALAAQWEELSARAHASRMKYLWIDDPQGGYLRNAFNPATGKSDDSCFLCALAGEWGLASAGLPVHMDPARLRQATQAIARLNVGRRGMTDQSGRPETRAFMQYPLAYYAAAALWAGHGDLAWRFASLQDEIITRPPSSHFHQTLTYTWEGEPCGLPYYMTSPACWLLLEAVSGVVPDVPGRRLALAPRPLPGQRALRVPVFLPTSWFMLNYRAEEGQAQVVLEPLRRAGEYRVERLRLRLPRGGPWQEVTLRGEKVEWTAEGDVLDLAVSFDPGQEGLEVWLR